MVEVWHESVVQARLRREVLEVLFATEQQRLGAVSAIGDIVCRLSSLSAAALQLVMEAEEEAVLLQRHQRLALEKETDRITSFKYARRVSLTASYRHSRRIQSLSLHVQMWLRTIRQRQRSRLSARLFKERAGRRKLLLLMRKWIERFSVQHAREAAQRKMASLLLDTVQTRRKGNLCKAATKALCVWWQLVVLRKRITAFTDCTRRRFKMRRLLAWAGTTVLLLERRRILLHRRAAKNSTRLRQHVKGWRRASQRCVRLSQILARKELLLRRRVCARSLVAWCDRTATDIEERRRQEETQRESERDGAWERKIEKEREKERELWKRQMGKVEREWENEKEEAARARDMQAEEFSNHVTLLKRQHEQQREEERRAEKKKREEESSKIDEARERSRVRLHVLESQFTQAQRRREEELMLERVERAREAEVREKDRGKERDEQERVEASHKAERDRERELYRQKLTGLKVDHEKLRLSERERFARVWGARTKRVMTKRWILSTFGVWLHTFAMLRRKKLVCQEIEEKLKKTALVRTLLAWILITKFEHILPVPVTL